MILATSREELRSALSERSGAVALVPTLGALHDGHLALVAEARARANTVVVSIFVNPLQFGPDEDFDAYPRTLDQDLAACASHGVDVVFAPSVETIYPRYAEHLGHPDGSPAVRIDPGPAGRVLEGAIRPGHFCGVLTVVAKLFGLVRPDAAVFGTKDFQQLSLIRQMVDDLCLGVEVVGVETVREPDGLALSSRNRYLTPEQRVAARALSRALLDGAALAASGRAAVLARAREVLDAADGVTVDYLVLLAPDLCSEPSSGEARLLVAARVGSTRLIDNLKVVLPGGRP